MARGLQAIWLTVEDFDRSVAFYRLLLEQEPTAILKGKGGTAERTACFELLDGTRLMLWYDPVVGGALQEARNPARVDLDLEIEDAQAIYERLVRSGIEPLTRLAEHELGGRTFDIQDPDGNRIRLGNRWSTPIRKL